MIENKSRYLPSDNEDVFAISGSSIKWDKRDVAIRTLTKRMKLEKHVFSDKCAAQNKTAVIVQF